MPTRAFEGSCLSHHPTQLPSHVPNQQIMIIRHAEKPEPLGGTPFGVSIDGVQSTHDLTVRGWQRAGALVGLFKARADEELTVGLATPVTIFATGVTAGSKSLRPQDTVRPLADALGIDLDTRYAEPDAQDLARAALDAQGPVLIAWHHEHIADVVDAISGHAIAPRPWPDDRFDLVWSLHRAGLEADWLLTQIPQLLLAGDRSAPI